MKPNEIQYLYRTAAGEGIARQKKKGLHPNRTDAAPQFFSVALLLYSELATYINIHSNLADLQ